VKRNRDSSVASSGSRISEEIDLQESMMEDDDDKGIFT
jgi:hypothetical protein